MLEGRRGVVTQLIGNDQIVANAVFPGIDVRDAHGAAEAMDPTQEWKAERAPASAPELLLQIALFAAESSQPRVEAGPCGLTAGERPKSLKADFERRRRGVVGSRIGAPHPEHAGRPSSIHMRGEGAQIVVDQRPLKQI